MRLFVDQLTNLDFSYLDPKRGLVGETWLANIAMDGTLDEQGMVCDFSTVKKRIRNWLDDNIDHKLLVPTGNQKVSISNDGERQTISIESVDGLIRTMAPVSSHTLIDTPRINKHDVAQWCATELKKLFPESVDALHLDFSCEQIDGPFYHYTHGLKKHLGNCQRITHGHRSKIEIWRNDELALDLMQTLADEWQDIYIGSAEDSSDDPKQNTHYLFEYQAQQGLFSLSIPKAHCYLINTESTVELIAHHLAERFHKAEPQSKITVKAYEGKNKGAIVTAG
jgi:6-pyruvoyl-tetrahydropterin synthase